MRELFNNAEALVEGWYPLMPARKLKRGVARSFAILGVRFAVWRGEDGEVRATESKCPHMGADLANGRVVGNHLQCYFHRWTFSGEGRLVERPCSKQKMPALKIAHYPVREFLGQLWIYPGENVRTPLLGPPGLERRKLHSVHVATFELLAHHHVMFAGGIDLQHFSTVHNIDIDFKADHRNLGEEIFEWAISGKISTRGWRGRLGRWLVGERFTYHVRVGGGSMVAITYGEPPRSKFSLPQLHVVWGCTPQKSGLSMVRAFSVVERKYGLFGRLQMGFRHLLTIGLLAVLKDDDVKAFPNMRFDVAHPMPEDRTVLELIRAINQMPESQWTKPFSANVSRDSVSNIGL